VRHAHGHDDVVNCLTGCSGVRFVLQKRCVGGVNVTMEIVGRQGGQVVLLRLHPSSAFLSAVRTISGLPPRSVSNDACCIDADPSRNSSMKLAKCLAVDELARASSRERGGRLP